MIRTLPENPALLARHKIAFRIAETLAEMFADNSYDVDEAYQLIETMIPLTNAEAEAELEAFDCKERESPGLGRAPGLLTQIKQAVSATPEMSIVTTLKAIIIKCKERDELLELCERLTAPQISNNVPLSCLSTIRHKVRELRGP